MRGRGFLCDASGAPFAASRFHEILPLISVRWTATHPSGAWVGHNTVKTSGGLWLGDDPHGVGTPAAALENDRRLHSCGHIEFCLREHHR